MNVRMKGETASASPRNYELLDRVAELVEPDDVKIGAWFAGYCRTHRERLVRDLDIVETEVHGGARVLEYGAVPLLMTAALQERGFEVSSLDVAPERFSGAIERLELDVRRCDVESEPVPFPAATFDAVIFNELFEHLRINPIFTMTEAHRVLRPGGTLLLSTPNLRSFRGIRNLVARNSGHASSGGVYEQYEKLETLGHCGHVREYTTKEVCDFLARVGFCPQTLIFRGGHGAGLVGLAERAFPGFRPFFTVVAVRDTATNAEAESTSRPAE